MILNYFKRFNHIHLRPLIQTLSIANRSIIIKSELFIVLIVPGSPLERGKGVCYSFAL